MCRKAGWATAHLSVLGHDTGNCIVTQGLGGRAGARCSTPQHGVIGLRYDHDTAYDTAGLEAVRAAARAHGLARGESRYKSHIMAGSNRLCRHMAQQGWDTAL